MVVLVLLVASVILCSASLMSVGNPPWMNRTETRWLLALQSSLLLLAFASPNLWVGVVIAWIAIHPWVAHIAYNYHIIPFAPTRNSVYEPLFPVLWWAATYNVIARFYRQGDWVVIAYAIIVWSFINIAAAIYQHYSKYLPSWWIDSRSQEFPNVGGLVGGSYSLSLITAVGAFMTLMLSEYVSGLPLLVILFIVFTVLSVSSWVTRTRSPIISMLAVIVLYAAVNYSSWYFIMFALTPITFIRIGESERGKYLLLQYFSDRISGWKSALRISISTYFLGIGLGMWNAITATPDDTINEDIAWRNLHNDWLQSVVELSPVPALCAMGLLISQWITLTLSFSQDHLFGLLLITMFSIYAIVYFPMRDHVPSLLIAISLAAMGS